MKTSKNITQFTTNGIRVEYTIIYRNLPGIFKAGSDGAYVGI